MKEDQQPRVQISVEGDAQDSTIIVGERNVVQRIRNIINKTDPKQIVLYLGLSILAIVLITAGAWNYYLKYDRSYMGGQLNIVIVPFLEEKEGIYTQSEEGIIVAQYFYAHLRDTVIDGEFERETNIRVEVRGPQESPPLRRINWKGADNAAQNLATEINAHIVIYGVISHDDFNRPSVSTRFYVSPDQFGDAQEILGENELGNPILLLGDIETGRDLESENEELRNRLQVTSLLMKAIGAYIGEDFPKALDYLKLALSDDLWKQTTGKEVVYLLAGNTVSRQALPILLKEGEERGMETIRLGEYYYNQALLSARPKGDYARAYIGLAGVENFYATYKARLTANFSDIDRQAIDREEQYLEKALAASYKPVSADITEKVAFNRAQVFFLRSQLSGVSSDLDQARENYQIVIDSYNSGNTRVRELAAHSYSGLAMIGRAGKHYEEAIANFEKAFEITRIPSLQALYLYHTGNVYYETKDWENALKYYNAAMEMKEDLQKRITQDQIRSMEEKIHEIKARLAGERTSENQNRNLP